MNAMITFVHCSAGAADFAKIKQQHPITVINNKQRAFAAALHSFAPKEYVYNTKFRLHSHSYKK
jgi:hypothetical protein